MPHLSPSEAGAHAQDQTVKDLLPRTWAEGKDGLDEQTLEGICAGRRAERAMKPLKLTLLRRGKDLIVLGKNNAMRLLLQKAKAA